MLPPLAERMRPHTPDQYLGQAHLMGPDGIIRRMIDTGSVASFILWGPPGVGKTTLARIIAEASHAPFYTLSAVTSGVKDVRDVIDRCRRDAESMFSQGRPILFIDEIHRFSKSQQDSLLGAVESGVLTLIGATTENPSFEVIRPLLSRARVYTLEPLGEDDLRTLTQRAITEDVLLKERRVDVRETTALHRYSGGDARRLLGILELLMEATPASDAIIIDDRTVTQALQAAPTAYDRQGEMHYDIVSAFIKSMRGSDPDAAVYWLARMIAGGEDPMFIARRMVILAAEDVGLANPNALLLANATMDAVAKIGMPEGRIPLSECAIYLATSSKSNSAYMAIASALKAVEEHGDLPVPLHLRNAPTSLMKNLSYGKGYQYAHDFPGNFVRQQYRPDALTDTFFYHPCRNAAEDRSAALQASRWGMPAPE